MLMYNDLKTFDVNNIAYYKNCCHCHFNGFSRINDLVETWFEAVIVFIERLSLRDTNYDFYDH